jgi:hypothetical protein
MSIGDRGEELLGLLYRLGGLTASQYAGFAAPPDGELQELGRLGGETSRNRRRRLEKEREAEAARTGKPQAAPGSGDRS